MTIYRSKIDAWLAAVLGLAVCAPLFVLALTVVAGGGRARDMWPALAIVTMTSAFVVWVFRGTRYAFDADALIVRSGPFRWRVPFASIQSVRPTRSVLSSPALSLDRLEVRYGGGRVLLISPADRARFLADLTARAPQAF